MARKGHQDRGLLSKIGPDGKERWYVRLMHDGKERRFGSFPTKTKAREFYQKAKTEQHEGRFFPERYQHGSSLRVEEWIAQYVAMLPGSGKTLSTQRDERYYARWWSQRLAGKRLHQLKEADILAVKRELTEKGLSPETIKHYLKCFRHILNVAMREGKLTTTPFKPGMMPKVGRGKTRFLTPEEEERLLQELGPIYAPWARLAILTGLRKTELFSLTWAQVDLELSLLTLPQTKSGDVQYVPLNAEAQSILRGFDTWQFSKWVFPSKTTSSHLDSYNFYGRVFMPAVRRAGLEGVTWHTLRHTFASRLAMQGHNASTIASLLRHSSLDLVQRYAHLSPSHLRAAVEGVAQFGKTAEPASAPRYQKETVTETVTKENEVIGEGA